MNKPLDFTKFNTGTLFLVRTPDVFPVGYADESFADMKNNLHFDFAALLETWNCDDGIVWKHPDFPRSSFWKDEPRDPIEECFVAADKYDMAFLPEAGMMHRAFMEAHSEGMLTDYDGRTSRYGRIGLTPACPLTLEYFIAKYDALLSKYGVHPSCSGVCMPCENSVSVTYDKYTREAWRKTFGYEMPSPKETMSDRQLEMKVLAFMEKLFLDMYCGLAKHVKQKYNLPLMHYPNDVVSSNSFFQPTIAFAQGNISVMNQVEDLDMLNLQLHPPLHPNPYFFKFEAEYLMGNSTNTPCMADTHFYHEFGGGRLLDTTPKRIVDNILSTLTPYGISFFCYGFMREELPLWKKELNPGAPVYSVYEEPHTQKARREMAVRAMDYVEQLRPWMEGTSHQADVAIYYPESINNDYVLGSYPLEHAFGLHELLNAGTIPVNVVNAVPLSPEKTKCLILDAVMYMQQKDLDALKAFVAANGKVIVVGKCSKEIQEILGLNISESTGRFVVSEASEDYHHCLFRLPESGRHYTESNGEPFLRYNNDEPAFTKAGNVLFIGASDAVDRFSDYRDFQLAAWVKQYFYGEKLNSGVTYHNIYRKEQDWHQFVSLDIFGNEEKKLLLVRNFGVDQDNARMSWDLPEDMCVTAAVVDGKPYCFENNVELPSYEFFVAVLAEKKQ